jgi:hypothetical protein
MPVAGIDEAPAEKLRVYKPAAESSCCIKNKKLIEYPERICVSLTREERRNKKGKPERPTLVFFGGGNEIRTHE